jgi:hypothetical protein
LFASGRHFSQSSHAKKPSWQAQTGPGIDVVVSTDDPVVVVDSIVVVGPGITVVVVVAIGLQKQHPSESVSIFIPAAHLLIVQYGAQCI